MTEEHKKKIGDANRGRVFSVKHREALRESHLGQVAWNKGKKTRPQTDAEKQTKREAMLRRKARLGYINSPEARKKFSESLRGRILSPESRKKMSLSHKGKRCGAKNNLWRGGIYKSNQIARAGVDYKLWREAVFKRDNYTCQNFECGARSAKGKGVILNADHIKPFSLYPELRYAIDNGRTLCVPCHRLTPTYGFRISTYKALADN